MKHPVERGLVTLLAVGPAACGGAVAGSPGTAGSGGTGGPGGDGGSGGHGGSGRCLPTESTVLTPVCRADGWCWIDPYPQGFNLLDAAGAGPETVLDAPFPPNALWPEGGGRAWIVDGSGAIARWDGQGWVRLDRRLGPLLSLDRASDGILHAVGADGRVVRIDPVSLQATALLPEPGWALVLGMARTPNDLWVVWNLDGLGADIWRWNGCRWTPAEVELDSSGELSAAGGTLFGFTKLLDLETPPDLLRHDGRAATTIPLPGFPTALRALGPDEAPIAITSERELRAPDGRVLRYRDGTLTPVAEYAAKIVEVMEHGDGVRPSP